jgi:hypothetical protein
MLKAAYDEEVGLVPHIQKCMYIVNTLQKTEFDSLYFNYPLQLINGLFKFSRGLMDHKEMLKESDSKAEKIIMGIFNDYKDDLL